MIRAVGWVALICVTTLLMIPIYIASQFRDDNDPDDDSCELVGTFSLVTQAFLGLLCLSSLVVKRFYEYPIRRSWQVWLFDVMKQLIGALGVHVFNVLVSVIKSKTNILMIISNTDDDDKIDNNPCNWYFLNIVFDCTIGVYVLFLIFKVVNWLCRDILHMNDIESGSYGPNPLRPSFRAFFKQLAVYFLCIMLTKVVIVEILNLFEVPLIWFTSEIILKPLDKFPEEVEIFIVIFVVPVVMNMVQFVLVDNIIQNNMLLKVNSGAGRHLVPDHEVVVEEAEGSNASYGAIEE